VTDEEFLAVQAGVALIDKARRAITARQHTDRPGSDWHIDRDERPKYVGRHNVATLFASKDGTKYDVIVYTYAGDHVLTRSWKGLETAFKRGQELADKPA
jgi:hypothetical protein